VVLVVQKRQHGAHEEEVGREVVQQDALPVGERHAVQTVPVVPTTQTGNREVHATHPLKELVPEALDRRLVAHAAGSAANHRDLIVQ